MYPEPSVARASMRLAVDASVSESESKGVSESENESMGVLACA